MKSLKKILSIFAAFMMVVGLTVTNTSAAGEKGTITLENRDGETTYNLYKVFEAEVSSDVSKDDDGVITGISYYTASSNANVIQSSGVFELVSDNVVQNNRVEVKIKGTTDGARVGTWLTTGTPTGLAQLGITSPVSTVGPTTVTTNNVEVGNSTIVWKNLEPGYYLITSSTNSTANPLVTITSVTPDQTVIDKNTKDPNVPDDSKKIIDKEGDNVTILDANNSNQGSAATAQVGDTISYQIQFETRNHRYAEDGKTPIDITSYTVTDDPVGLDIKPKTVKVQVGDTVIYQNGAPTTDSITNGTNGDVFKITADSISVKLAWKNENGTFRFPSPSTLTITYDATLKATTGTNGANVNYGGADDPITEVKVHTADINILKIDGATQNADTPTPLAGAVFELYTDEACTATNKVHFTVKGSNGKYTVDPNGAANTELVTAADGTLSLEGLKQGTSYWLKEIKAPEGYSLMLQPKEIKTGENKSATATMVTPIKVNNNKGTNLPSTGGMGTTMIYIAGAILMVGAAIIFVTNKRMKHE